MRMITRQLGRQAGGMMLVLLLAGGCTDESTDVGGEAGVSGTSDVQAGAGVGAGASAGDVSGAGGVSGAGEAGGTAGVTATGAYRAISLQEWWHCAQCSCDGLCPHDQCLRTVAVTASGRLYLTDSEGTIEATLAGGDAARLVELLDSPGLVNAFEDGQPPQPGVLTYPANPCPAFERQTYKAHVSIVDGAGDFRHLGGNTLATEEGDVAGCALEPATDDAASGSNAIAKLRELFDEFRTTYAGCAETSVLVLPFPDGVRATCGVHGL